MKTSRFDNIIHAPNRLQICAFLVQLEEAEFQLLRDELRLRKFGQSQVVLQQLIESGVNLGELQFFQGELYRMRSEPNDEERAIEAYHKALAYEDVPLEVHRELGFLYMRSGKRDEARKALRNYITSNSGADDKAMIEFYLEQLE